MGKKGNKKKANIPNDKQNKDRQIKGNINIRTIIEIVISTMPITNFAMLIRSTTDFSPVICRRYV